MEGILRRVHSSERLTLALKIGSHASVMAVLISFIAMLARAYINAPFIAVLLAGFAGIPLALVTLARRLINARRPYEVYDFYEDMPRSKSGQSFPSRHVFSAFVIATLAYIQSLPLAIILAVLGLIIAVSRVLLGIHFVRDVAVGAVLGVLFGILGLFVMKGSII